MSLADKQLLVTGANGNLGKAAVAELRRLGAKK
jgi:NAD(P)-dependent dehydrogenase (short-subunit alcohol dehydrogenase family)